MNTDFERIESLFSRAIEFRPEERPAFLAGACGDNPKLLARIEALLDAHEASADVLPQQPRTRRPVAEQPGMRIGHYKLLQQIGEGGCGIVYMAAQEQPVRRRVALKLIKLGMDTKSVVARFEAERQALALMDHPNIAKVFDGGATDTGRPYFVMELVRGVKITDFCEVNDLSAPQRLNLFIQVCRAIQHAHQKGVIHRDVKPSNVLVSVHDGVPVPKVIDFGIAKAIEGRLTDQTLFTCFEQFIGTPAYMSPEQAELKGLDVDTRTDIYSLGVLLYELLTGSTPFDTRDLLSAGVEEMRRTIREKEPLRPSTRLTMELTQAESKGRQARNQRSDSKNTNQKDEPGGLLARKTLQTKELISLLRGDLDWIVMKCLEKDRRRRYETANGLATDLQRHLNGEPVTARPPSNSYRFRKLVRRNKLTFVAGAAVALALMLGTIGSTWEAIHARRAEREQIRLRQEADNARSGESKQRAAAEQHLYEALLGEARAKQLSGVAGQRLESLEAIGKAAAVRRSPELRDAAIAAFSLLDLRDKKQWRFSSHALAEKVCFDPQFALYACRTPTNISVRGVEDDREVAVLPLDGSPEIVNGMAPRRFDANSRYLLATCPVRDGFRCRVWDVRRGTLMLDEGSGLYTNPDFSPDSRTFAIANGDGSISMDDIESGKEAKRWSTGATNNFLRFSPDGKKLAALEIGAYRVQLWDVASSNLVTTLVALDKLVAVSWNDDGSLVAGGRDDGAVIVWELQSGHVRAQLEGHESPVTALAFSHHGDLLATGSWDSTLRLWDLTKRRQLLLYRTQDTEIHFSDDDQVLGPAIAGDTVKLLDVCQATGYRRMSGGPNAPNSWSVEFSPDGRFLVAGTVSGLRFWDARAGTEIGLLHAPNSRSAHFMTNGGLTVIASSRVGIFQWPLQTRHDTGGDFLRVGAPTITMAQQSFDYLSVDRAGHSMVVARELPGDPFVLNLDSRTNVVPLKGLRNANRVSIDPSGHWTAVGTWKGTGANVYATDTGKLVRNLQVKGSANALFSSDGNWLAVASQAGIAFWKTGTWEPLERSIAADQVTETTPTAFSPDGSLLAAASARCEVRIFKFPECEPVATLKPQTGTGAAVSSICFSPNGNQLAAIEWNGQLNLWDLGATRGELEKLSLDWKLPTTILADETPATTPARLVLDAGPFSKTELAERIRPRDSRAAANVLDLGEYFNAPLSGSWYDPAREGNDLSLLPSGLQQFNGIQFDVRGLIQVGALGANGLAYPNHVPGIPVQKRCRRLHFLHAAILASSARSGDELGSYILRYTDGRTVEVPIVMGKDVADWWSQPSEQSQGAKVVWTGSNPAAERASRTIRLFQTTWENPFPDSCVGMLDFVSDKPTPGQPFLLAVTAD